MPGDFTYNVTTDPGKVRLLLNDVDEVTAVFDDDEIAAFLALEGGSVKRAAAQAIDTNATNEALASKVLRTQDVATDGAKLADAMRKHADGLRAQADREETDADTDAGSFVLVNPVGSCSRPPELTEWPTTATRPPYFPFC